MAKVKTLFQIIKRDYRKEYKQWDKWDYKVYGPISLDDDASIVVYLKNQDGTGYQIIIEIV